MATRAGAAAAARTGRRADERSDDWRRRRRELLDTAAEVFFRRGFQAGTTKEIAELAGMSQSTIYHYVPSKEQFMAEIARQVSTDFTEALHRALDGDPCPRQRLGRVIDAFVSSLVVNQKTFAVYWQEYRSIPADAAREARALERAFVARVEEVVAAAQDAGVLPAGHATHVLSEGILGMLSWTYWWYRPGEHTPQQVSAAYRDLVGLGCPRGPRARPVDERAEERTRKRRELLDIAAGVFFRRGFEAGTTKEIAELAGMSQSTIYHYFPSKERLMEEIARQVYGDFSEALDRALTGDRSPAAQLGRVIDAFAASVVVNQKTFAVYWKEYRSIPREVAREAHAQERAYVGRVERIVAAAQEQGVLPSRHATQVLSEGVLGMLSWMHWWYRPGEHTPQQVAAAFRDLVGLGGR
ncbi:TetR family transcriptional regulator [Streptomyces sp. B1866]|uniref:TetR family transcriptional regulator n=1 Tax=Streptomyces sp. B1866 TaxID=3075431 RepID=UPI00288EAC5B|nr:TetR family transcriptional regulator [Streptomyces sp. B1866]MDT3398203.1 TetR family transcriptional regulator [Streptomyces sp. B1866]